jgi:hypothetical protein
VVERLAAPGGEAVVDQEAEADAQGEDGQRRQDERRERRRDPPAVRHEVAGQAAQDLQVAAGRAPAAVARSERAAPSIGSPPLPDRFAYARAGGSEPLSTGRRAVI